MRTRRHVFMPVALAAAFCAGPAVAHAQTGGAEAGQPIPGMASASDGAITVTTRTGGLVGTKKTFRGTIGPSGAGRTVTVERFDDLIGQWSAIARTPATADGSFAARWKPDRPGPQRVRARVEAPDASAASAAPEIRITLYKAARATWYGPGFYGRRTGCRQKMSKTLQGVAHKTLPCGTQVALLYRGRTVTVPVVDRGPFANDATWDLTAATARELDLEGIATVGALTVK